PDSHPGSVGRSAMTFHLPDTLTALPLRPFEFSPGAQATRALHTQEPSTLYRALLRDQESESTLLLARHILHVFLPVPNESDVDSLLAEARAELTPIIAELRGNPDVLRERAPLALLGACWLEAVSQPATQPSIIVNRLYTQHFAQRGGGNPHHSVAA